jgi:HEAT repeat protein
MTIRFRCQCGKIVKVEEKYAGRRATCPHCGAQLVVPNVSAAPEAGGPNAKADPSAQLPETPALELQLESEGPGPGGKADDASPGAMELESDIPAPDGKTGGAAENLMELESDSLDAGGKTGDNVEEVMEVEEVEEVAPTPETSEVVPEPDDSIPAAALSEAASEKVCPNCGVAVSPNATACAECGVSLMPKKAPAKKKFPIPKALQTLREHKAFPLIAVVGAVVLILIVTVVVVAVRKSKKGAPVAVAELRPKPRSAQEPKTEMSKPPPEVQFHWPGFSDPAAIARDRILKIGQELAAYVDKNHQPPATLAEAGVAEADSADYTYVGAEIAALPRFHAMAYETKPSASYEPCVLFSDGSARPVPAAQTLSVLLNKAGSGWVTAADAALLAKTAPLVRVTNPRFASLEVALDDKPAGVAPHGGECVITAAAGPHQITFTAGEQKESFQADLKPGIVYAFVYPRQADLPWIPMRQIRAGLTGQSAPPPEKAPTPPGRPATPPGRPATPPPDPALTFTPDKKEGLVKSVTSSTQTVDFLDKDGRTAVALDLRSIAAKITRENEGLTIEGPGPDMPILVNEIGRVEAGIVKFKGDITVTFRKTALGTLRCEELPNTDPAAVSLPETEQAEQSKPPASNPGTAPAPRPTFPTVTFTLLPDCEALAGALASSAPAAVQLLLQRAQLEPKPAEAAPAETPPVNVQPLPNGPQGRRGMPPPGFMRGAAGRGQRPPQTRGGAPGKPAPEATVERPLRPPQEISASLVYGALAFYGDPSAFDVLKTQVEKIPAESSKSSPASPPLLLALARSGGISALSDLRTASANAPTSAVIALSTIDDPAARQALAEILAKWTPDEVVKAVDGWPVVAGPACRITFIEALASAKPALLDDLAALNALMKLDPFALERALAARLTAEPAQPPPESPSAPQPPATGRRGRGPMGRGPGPMPGMNRAGPMPAQAGAFRSPAPPSWLALAYLKNDAAVTRFVQLLSSDNDLAKRLGAAAALGEAGDPSVVPILITLLTDKEAEMRRTAARSLTQMPDAAVVAALEAAVDKNLLVSAIVEQAPAIAAKAGSEATAKLLAKMLTIAAGEKSAAVASPSSESSAPSPENKPPMIQGGMNRGGRGIGRGMRGRGPAPAPSPAPTSSPKPPPSARKAGEPGMATPIMILEAINRLGLYSPEVKTALEAARESPEADVRAAAYKAREQAVAADSAADRSASAIAAAGLALKDKDGTVRCAGIGLLSAADPKEALALLLPAVKDPDPDVRSAALAALPEIAGDPDIAAAIKEALSDKNPDVVRAAAVAVERRPALGADAQAALSQAVGPLTLLLTDPKPDVRIAAIRALGKLKDPAATSSLQSVLTDKDPKIVEEAVRALSELDAPDAVKASFDALALGKETLPDDLRHEMLTRLAAHCADANSAYGSWATSGPALKDLDLGILEEMASSATADVRAGLIAIATRYLTDSRLETKQRASAILACFADDAAARKVLLDALEQDTTGIAQGAADMLRRLHDDSMIDAPLLAYYKALCETSGAPGGRPGMAGGRGLGGRGALGAPQRGGAPAAAAPPPPKFPGLAKATAEESAVLRAAIIEALGDIGGDHAGKALKTILDLEERRNSDEMAPYLIAAAEKAKASSSILICEYYAGVPGRYRLDAISALMHVAPLDSTRVREAIQRLAASGTTPSDVAAAARDALDEIASAGGA